jgi:hypothetical protein
VASGAARVGGLAGSASVGEAIGVHPLHAKFVGDYPTISPSGGD